MKIKQNLPIVIVSLIMVGGFIYSSIIPEPIFSDLGGKQGCSLTVVDRAGVYKMYADFSEEGSIECEEYKAYVSEMLEEEDLNYLKMKMQWCELQGSSISFEAFVECEELKSED